MARVAALGTFDGIEYLYYVEPYFAIPSGYTGQVSMLGVLIGKSINGADPTAWQQVSKRYITRPPLVPPPLHLLGGGSRARCGGQACASMDGTDMYHAAANGLPALVALAQSQPSGCGPNGLPMCSMPPGIPSVVNFGIPLASSFVTAADFDGQTSVVVRVTLSAYSAKGEMITTSVSMSYLLTSQTSITQMCTNEVRGAQTLADVIQVCSSLPKSYTPLSPLPQA